MGKYDILIKCAQIKKLIEENKFTKAVEELDSLNMRKVTVMSDLKLFARIYEKADRLEEAKDIYYGIYEKTGSKHTLYQLILMELRTDDLDNAKGLYEEYKERSGVDLDTYELRYRIAKAAGAKRQELIDLLEELRKEEFTEEWGFQRAKLYELEGDRKKVVEVCDQLILWFGTGNIIDKARDLREEVSQPDWQKPCDDTIPEPMEPEIDEKAFVYAAPVVAVQDMDDIEETAASEEEIIDEGLEEPEEIVKEATEEIIDEGVEESEEIVEEAAEEIIDEGVEEPEEIVEEAVEEAAEEIIDEGVEEPLEIPEKPTIPVGLAEGVSEVRTVPKEPEQLEEIPQRVEKMQTGEAVSEPKVVEKKPVPERKIVKPEPIDENNVLISNHSIFYFSLKDTIKQIQGNTGEMVHFSISGGEEKICLAIAKKLIKELNAIGYFSADSIAKIQGSKLNGVDIEEKIKQLLGGCMLILNAQEMETETVEKILAVIENHKKDIVFILTGEYDELDCWFSHYPELQQLICYKVKL